MKRANPGSFWLRMFTGADMLQEAEELTEGHQLQHVRDLLRKKPACG